MPDHFFFYGTLIPQYAPDHLREILAGLFLLGEGSCPGSLYDFGNYPGAVFDEASPSRVFGRVYWGAAMTSCSPNSTATKVTTSSRPAEGEYIRQRRNVTLANGDVVECWMYDYNWSTEGFPIVTGGGRRTKANVETGG